MLSMEVLNLKIDFNRGMYCNIKESKANLEELLRTVTCYLSLFREKIDFLDAPNQALVALTVELKWLLFMYK